MNVAPSRHMLFTRHRDMPGIIGQLGSVLGEHNVNIASMQVGRRIVRGDAVMVLSLDDPIPASLLATIHQINEYVNLADIEPLKNIYRRVIENLDALERQAQP